MPQRPTFAFDKTGAYRIEFRRYLHAFTEWRTKCVELGFKVQEIVHHDREVISFWQADHIVAVAEGGGECGIDNLQTLCTPCHKRKTAELAARLALKRREECKSGN